MEKLGEKKRIASFRLQIKFLFLPASTKTFAVQISQSLAYSFIVTSRSASQKTYAAKKQKKNENYPLTKQHRLSLKNGFFERILNFFCQ